MTCVHCDGRCKKNGSVRGRKRFRCLECGRSFAEIYVYTACRPDIDRLIISHHKESCGIRSIARLLGISKTSVLRRICAIGAKLEAPPTPLGQDIEIDELCTYVGSRRNQVWITYAMVRQTRSIMAVVVGRRSNDVMSTVTDAALASNPRRIHTDRLQHYRSLIEDRSLHSTRRHGTNHIERMNLNLRTHLKRLGKKTICYSKSLAMLMACLKIYFWS